MVRCPVSFRFEPLGVGIKTFHYFDRDRRGEETFGFSGFASNRKVCYRELRINFGGFMFGSVSVGLEIHFLSFFNFRIIK